MPFPATTYDSATIVNPTGALTDFVAPIDLSRMSAAWWAAVNTTDGTRGRVFLPDGTELACDWIAFDPVAKTGWLRVKIPSWATSGSMVVRVYPPNTINAPVAAAATYGQYAAYDAGWSQYLPFRTDLANRVSGGLAFTAVAGSGSAPAIATIGGRPGVLFDGTNYLESTANIQQFGHLTALAWCRYATGNDGVMTGVWFNNIRLTQSSFMHNNDDRSVVSALDATRVYDQWGHAGASNGATDAYFYRDGVDVTNSVIDALPWTLSESGKKLTIGARASGNSQHMAGHLAELQLHSVQRSAAWIKHEYEMTNDQAAMVGAWTNTPGPSAGRRRAMVIS